MAIPDFETIMRPLLNHLSDGNEHGTEETIDVLAKEFSLSDEERRQLLPSGRQLSLRNRVAWAKFYLKKAGAVEARAEAFIELPIKWENSPPRSARTSRYHHTSTVPLNSEHLFKIVKKGEEQALESVTTPTTTTSIPKVGTSQPQYTPEELISIGHSQITAQLSADLIETIKSASPVFFERLVVELLLALGYGGSRQDAGRIMRSSGDEGIDGVMKEDRLGLDTIYIQAKKWESVSQVRPEIQKFAGALQGQRAEKRNFHYNFILHEGSSIICFCNRE